MSIKKRIFVGLLMVAFTVSDAFAAPDCRNRIYRQAYPEHCQNYKANNANGTFLALVGGAALIGAGVALATQTSGGGGQSQSISNQNNVLRTTVTSDYSYSQNDIVRNQRVASYYFQSNDSIAPSNYVEYQNIQTSEKYTRNYKQYNAINFAAAPGRGLSGANVNINVIDDFKSEHGHAVSNIITYIAPEANIATYDIASGPEKLKSYEYIANTFNSGRPANIYNASWQSIASENKNAATVIYDGVTTKTYAQSQQYLRNITNEAFINHIQQIARDNDAIFVWAAGNEQMNESGALSAMPIAFPELQGHFVNVVALDTRTNEIAWYSNKCGITQNYCITAPGSNWDTDALDHATGTSFAAPVVSGAIATIKQAFPYMSATQITQLLFTTAQDIGTPGIDNVYGWGLLDMDAATRPVGTPKIVLSNENILPLNATNISGPGAMALKNADIKIAFIDDFGRAFTTNLSDNINVRPHGRGFDELRAREQDSVNVIGGFEFGIQESNILQSSGLISTKSNNLTNFIGYANNFDLNDLHFYQKIRIGVNKPTTTDQASIVSGFSNIYTTSVKMGATYHDLSFEFAIPDMITHGNMFLNVPIARDCDGQIIYQNARVDLQSVPSTQYTIKYKSLSMSYVNNHEMKNEFFIMAKGRFVF